jgi:hypothetical protein
MLFAKTQTVFVPAMWARFRAQQRSAGASAWWIIYFAVQDLLSNDSFVRLNLELNSLWPTSTARCISRCPPILCLHHHHVFAWTQCFLCTDQRHDAAHSELLSLKGQLSIAHRKSKNTLVVPP